MQLSDMIHFYGTHDIEEPTHFYVDLLGLKLVLDQGKCRIFEILDHSYIAFCEHLEVTHSYKSPLITFIIDDVDETYQQLKDKVNIIQPPMKNEQFQLYHFFCTDNNGYTLEFQRFLNPNWKEKQ